MPYMMQVAVGRRDRLAVFGGDYPTPDGTCVRDYIHVMDLAQGHLAALEALDRHGDGCRAFNLGTGTGTTVLEMVAAASEAVGRPLEHEVVARRPGDAVEVFADPSLAHAELGGRPPVRSPRCAGITGAGSRRILHGFGIHRHHAVAPRRWLPCRVSGTARRRPGGCLAVSAEPHGGAPEGCACRVSGTTRRRPEVVALP